MLKTLPLTPLTSSAWSAPSPPGAPVLPRPKEPSPCRRELWVLAFLCGRGLPVSQRLWLPWTLELCCCRMLWAGSIRPGWGVWERRQQLTKQWRSLISNGKIDGLCRAEKHSVRIYEETEHQKCVTLNKDKHFNLLKTFRRQQSSCLRQVWCGLVAQYGRIYVLSLRCLLQIQL